MSVVDDRAAIGGLFITAWGSTTEVSTPNTKFTPEVANWVRLNILPSDAFQVEFGNPGNNQQRLVGVVLINVFAELDKGDGKALQLAEQAAQIFRSAGRVASGTDGDIRFRAPVIRPIGPDQGASGGSSYYQVNVSIPYVSDAVF